MVFGIDYNIEKNYSATIPGEYELIINGINDYSSEVSAVYNVYCEHSFSNGKCTICGSLETAKGDVNKDDNVDISDATQILTYYARKAAGLSGGWNEILRSNQ